MDIDTKNNLFGILLLMMFGSLTFLLDNSLSAYIASLRTSSVNTIMIFFSSPWFLLILFYVATALFMIKRKHFSMAVHLGIGFFSSIIVSYLIKFIVVRPRPEGIMQLIPFLNVIDFSFPSSHAMLAFTAVPLLGREFPSLKWLWICLGCLVAGTRLYLGVHYLSDVYFGMLIGYAMGVFLSHKSIKGLLERLNPPLEHDTLSPGSPEVG